MTTCHARPAKRGLRTAIAAFVLLSAGTPAALYGQRAAPGPDLAAALSHATVAASALDLPEAPLPATAPEAVTSDSSPQESNQAHPDPQPVAQTTNPDAVSANGTQQTKRILGIMPNFRSVSADVKLPPQSAREKFAAAGHDSFDYSSFLIAGIQAGFAQNSASYPEFHQGAVGYGRYYWHTLADTASENFMVGGAAPALFRQDNRFYTLGHGGFRRRALYAASRILITREDNGNEMFNFSEVIGSGAASGVSTLYYPTKYRTWTKVGQKWLTSDIIDGANFTFKEFWPDINKKIFHTH